MPTYEPGVLLVTLASAAMLDSIAGPALAMLDQDCQLRTQEFCCSKV